MDTITNFDEVGNTYKVDDFNEFSTLNFNDLNNKLFCTFTKLDELDDLINSLKSQYSILYDKIFVLKIRDNTDEALEDEFVCTYNIDQVNLDNIPPNTILVHRKKESNTLYTINALNELIKKQNNGIVDTKFPIVWQHYRNTILLTQHDELKQLRTKLHRIIEL